MPDFTLFLPFEILAHIFSNMNQVDCIECMTVCRRWYTLIPRCGRNVWRELEISETSWSRFNNGMLECLGTHVKKVSIVSSTNSSKILTRLESQGCNIQSLEIRGYLQIYRYDLYSAALVFSAGLFRTLKELLLTGRCAHHFSLYRLLKALPALTHLYYKLEGHPNFRAAEYESISKMIRRNIYSTKENNHGDYNLLFLCLDCDFRFCHPIKKILKRCPRLKYFLCTTSVVDKYHRHPSIDFAGILGLCPSIRYAHWATDTIPSNIETEWLTLARRNTYKEDNINDYGEEETNRLRQVEFRDYDEQLHIFTLRACLRQPSLLEHLRLDGVSTVELYHLWNSFTQHNSSLIPRPSHLKSLELVSFAISRETGNDVSFKDFFSHFQHSERLVMTFSVTYIDNLEKNCVYARKVVEALGHQLHQLRYLHLEVFDFDRVISRTALFDTLLTTGCNWHQKLEILRLCDVFISTEVLLDLCDYPKLHTLNLSGPSVHEQLTNKSWISFARKRKEQEKTKNGTIQSIFLTGWYFDSVTDEVLEEFASIKSLRTLGIAGNTAITDAGVNKYESIRSIGSKNHKKIELWNCINVSLDNPHAVFAPTTF